jgi:hypothetical protein
MKQTSQSVHYSANEAGHSACGAGNRSRRKNDMGLGTLQVWITSEGNPCVISERDEHDNRPWVIAVWHCDGALLTWCGRKYFNIPAPCGHVELKLPPGCYVVRAADGQAITADGKVIGNHWSDHAVVTVCCDQAACVTLFSPTAHNCGIGFLRVLEQLVARQIMPDEARRAMEAMQVVINKLPESEFDKATLPAMAELLKSAQNPTPPPKNK